MPWNKSLDLVKETQWASFETLYDEMEVGLENGEKHREGCFMDQIRSRRKEFGFDEKDDLV